MRKGTWILLSVVALLTAYLTLWPTRVVPVRWEPPADRGFHGRFSSNGRLARYKLLAEEDIGAEALAPYDATRVITGTLDGRILRVGSRGNTKMIATTGGRPLGLKLLRDGSTVVVDAARGLLRISADGRIETLVDAEGGRKFGFPNALDVTADERTVYFTDSSARFGLKEYELDALEHGANGRLFAYDLADKRLTLFKEGLVFPNGIAISGDGSYALIAETWTYRVLRVELTGPRAGRARTVIDNLPAFPDNVTYDRARDVFWVALASPRDRALDWMAAYPALRVVSARLPRFMQPKPTRHAMALAIRGDGSVYDFLDDPSADSFSPVTSVLALGSSLFLGSLSHKGIAKVELSSAEKF